MKTPRLERLDAVRSRFQNPHVPVTVFARADVPIQDEGLDQLEEFLGLQETLHTIKTLESQGKVDPFWGDSEGRIDSVVVTPDFHRGGGIPVGVVIDARGFVIPAAIGNDICCGMRLLTTDVTQEEITPHLDALGHRLRAIFFQGQRNIPMSPRQREALLRDGLWGLHGTIEDNARTGIWQYYDPRQQADDLLRVHFQGVLPARDTFGFGDYIKASGNSDGRDPQIGSVGGGNHFVELQVVDEIQDGPTAHAWGLTRGNISIMAHSGSLGLGHMVGGHFIGKAHSLYPKGIPHPSHGFYVLPTEGPHAALAAEYLDAMRNAANFAFANRLCLGLMMTRALRDVLGRDVGSRLVYDAPHNLIWEPTHGDRHLHRKGACPAPGPSMGTFEYTGHPVIIPGSMGSASYVLAGEGNEGALCSACHGAGRGLTRGQAIHVPEGTYEREVAPLRVITAIDPESPQVKGRRDILGRHKQRLLEEAPGAYKSITPVVQTVEDAKVAHRVVRLSPIMTVKG